MSDTPYINAIAENNPAALDDCLTPNVRINDTGESDLIEGLEKVKQWAKTCGDQFHLKLEIQGVREENDKTVLTVLTSGDFDGSPQPFYYHFTCDNEMISKIDIFPG